MTLYVKLQDGAVTGVPQDLPQATASISNLRAAGAAKLLDLGWYPVTDAAPAIDRGTQRLGDRIYTINTDSVTVSNKIVSLTNDEQVNALKNAKIKKRAQLKHYRDDQTKLHNQVKYEGSIVNANDKSLLRLTTFRGNRTWYMDSGQERTITKAEADTLRDQVADRLSDNMDNYMAHKSAINDMTSVIDIDARDITTGWTIV